jgi:TRAP-type uncharacterized transport system substrate-binding protein
MGSVKEDFKEHIEASLELLRDRCFSLIRLLRETWPLLLLLVIIAGMVIWLAKPAPPRHVVIASGVNGSSADLFAKEYAEFFRQHGIFLEILPTSGSRENIARLLDQKNSIHVAFVQGGLLKPEEAKELLSLGSIGYDPLWFFHRGPISKEFNGVEALKTNKVAIGPPGSGTNALTRHIMKLNGISVGPNILEIPFIDAAGAIQRGEIDGMIIVDSLDALVRTLLYSPAVHLVQFTRVPAYTKQLHFIEAVQIPMGSIDMAKNLPPEDVQTIATTLNLLIGKNLHPAIQMLFMQAMTKVNGRESFFSQAKEFPSYKDPAVPESEIAQRYYQNGPPFLMRYLPFWLAEFIDRMSILLMPLIAFAYPIISSMPNFRRQRILKRLQQQYGKLKFLESEIINNYEPVRRDEYIQRLDVLERDVVSLKVPQSFAENYFQLRSNIDFVRGILNRLETDQKKTH